MMPRVTSPQFPTLADVDRLKRAIDDEFPLTISNFQYSR
jgi:hypothetical protein